MDTPTMFWLIGGVLFFIGGLVFFGSAIRDVWDVIHALSVTQHRQKQVAKESSKQTIQCRCLRDLIDKGAIQQDEQGFFIHGVKGRTLQAGCEKLNFCPICGTPL